MAQRFAFRSNNYYLSLIDWEDEKDPIRRIIIPQTAELENWGRLDPSNEHRYTVMRGLEHKYPSTALLLVSNVCDGFCRYCFRKRVFMKNCQEVLRDIPAAIQYIREHREITNVLLSGGDPLSLSTQKLHKIIKQLRQIEHIGIIRLGTKIPAYNPYRILNDRHLIKTINKYSTPQKRIYVITHFDHPREITDVAIKAIALLHKAGAVMENQTPLIRGINDDPFVLAELFRTLSFIGISPYYVFQCRPTVGNKPYAVPVEEGYDIFESAKSMVSGLAKTARYIMSHTTGKISIAGKTEDHIFFKYHRTADDEDNSQMIVAASNPQAYWFEDYPELIEYREFVEQQIIG